MKKIFLIIVAFSFGCAQEPTIPTPIKKTEPQAKERVAEKVEPVVESALSLGVRRAKSQKDFETTYNSIKTDLEKNPETTIIKEIDHQKNAKSKGLELQPTRVILYDEPKQTFPFIAENPVSGLDLPQRILVYERGGKVFVETSKSEYIQKRYEMTAVLKPALDLKILGTETDSTSVPISYEGMRIIDSKKNFDDTYAALKTILTKNENLNIMAEHDFAKSDSEKGKKFPLAKLLVFGNPKLGTPLMKKSPSIALDLPQKMLVYSLRGTVHIAYNVPEYLLSRHNVKHPEIAKKIAGALSKISMKAAE